MNFKTVKILKETSSKMYTTFNNMNHMHISGTEPSSVILRQTKWFKKLKSDVPKLPKQAKAKRDGVINPLNYNFNQF